MSSRIIKSDEQTFRARMDRRLQTGTVVAVDKIAGQALLDMGVTNPDGTPVYYAGVPFSPQQPPQPGDSVTLTYSNVSPHSVIIAGMQVGTQQYGGPNNAQVVSNGGVMSVEVSGQAKLTGDVTLAAGSNVTLAQSGQTITVSAVGGSGTPATTVQPVEAAAAVGASVRYAREDHAHAGVHSIAQSGQAALTGDVLLSAGSGVTLTQSGQTLQIAASGGGGISGIEVDQGGTPIGTRPALNLIAGANVALTVADNPGRSRVDITVAAGAGSGSPTWPVTILSSAITAYTALDGDTVLFCFSQTLALALTLPDPAPRRGKVYEVFDAYQGATQGVTVTASAGSVLGITGVRNTAGLERTSVSYISDGTNWHSFRSSTNN